MTEQLAREHQELGRAVVEWITEYMRGLDGRRVCSDATPGELEKLFAEELPQNGQSAEEILRQFAESVAPQTMTISSPRYYGLFNPTPLPIAVWADVLCSVLNQNGAAWRNSPSASVIEARVLRWLCELMGYDDRAFGTLTSGGSEANLIGLKCARDHAHYAVRQQGVRSAPGALVVYTSELSHYSLDKAVDILGLGREHLRFIATDDFFHLSVPHLIAQIERDLSEGFTPCCIAASAGATSNGVIDPLAELAQVAQRYGLWLHVDAAYGGALAFSPKHRAALRGLEQADSITVDPHKWMFVPFACGALLVRGGGQVLRDSFDVTPAYLSEARGGDDVPYDFFRYGQLGTRRFNALKVWMALKFLGARGYARIIESQIELTHYFAAQIERLENFQLVGQVETAVCCFRLEPHRAAQLFSETELDALQQRLQQRVEKSGEAWISSTVLKNRRALRVNVNSFLTQKRHLDDLLDLLRRESDVLLVPVIN